MSSVKRIRLEQKPMPVSSQEELSLITLREQNKRLGNNYSHRMRIEADLRKRNEQLEETLKQCEDKEPESQLTIINQDLRNRVDELEFELNQSRLNEKRLSLDLEQLNEEFIQLRSQTKASLAAVSAAASSGTTNPDSIRNPSTLAASNLQHAGGSNPDDSSQTLNHDKNHETNNYTNNTNFFAPSGASASPRPINISNDQINPNQANLTAELERKLSEAIVLAASRLKELESLQQQHKEAIFRIDQLELQAKYIPKESIIESPEYKTLQSHFSVLYNEATQLKTQLVESKSLIIDMKNSHARQIERMSHEENRLMNELRTNMSDLEQSLTDARNQMAVFRLDYDSLCKAHEQTLKLDTELKKSVNSYKIQVQQKNNDLNRMKRLIDESRRERHHHDGAGSGGKHSTSANNAPDGDNLKGDSNHSTSTHNPSVNQTPSHNQSNNNSHSNTSKPPNHSSSAPQNNSVNAPSPSNKKILELKEYIHQLQKQLDKTKSEEEALMQDLDVTGQAYEDMQEQNHRLLQQLEEKDDANLKLMSEHLKTNAFHKHLNEEKAQMEEYRDSLLKRIAAQENVVKSLEEKVSLLQENMNTLEKELEIRNNQNDSYRKEKLELGQELVELRLERDKLLGQMEDLRRSTKERISSLMDESSKNKRLIEKLESLEKKYERASKLQSASSPDEVLMEEIREYKEQLTCPSCKTKPKDAVLTKCFHVFCFDCLKTRVDTRQRKCPKCNAQFGANDFHRLYLA